MRGTGRSQRLDCPNLQHGVGPESITLSQCARRLGKRFVSYRTSAAADDVDAVRRALGLDRITLYGDSYGTFFAQSYAFRHPDTLRALVLDSAYPAIGESPWYGSLIRTGNRSLELACRRSPKCSGDAGRRLRLLVEYLRRTGRGVEGLLRGVRRRHLRHPRVLPARSTAPGTELRHGNPRPWKSLTRRRRPRRRQPALLRARRRAGRRLQRLPDDLGQAGERAGAPAPARAGDPPTPDNFGPFRPREIALLPVVRVPRVPDLAAADRASTSRRSRPATSRRRRRCWSSRARWTT